MPATNLTRRKLPALAAAVAWLALSALPTLALTPSAQSPRSDPASPAFEVASIRLANPNAEPSIQTTPDGFHATNVPLTALLRSAYAPTGTGDSGFFRLDRMVGVPDWLANERYDVVAKVSEVDLPAWKTPARQQEMLRAMLCRLLEERCKVVVHRGSKEMPIYALIVMKNGPKFKPAQTTDLTELHKLHPDAGIMPGGSTINASANPPHLEYFSTSMPAFALQLSTPAGRPVEDRTGLEGKYDFSLQFAGLAAHSENDDAPSIFTAVQQQLGLKLVPDNGQVETLVIDHVERPSEN